MPWYARANEKLIPAALYQDWLLPDFFYHVARFYGKDNPNWILILDKKGNYGNMRVDECKIMFDRPVWLYEEWPAIDDYHKLKGR